MAEERKCRHCGEILNSIEAEEIFCICCGGKISADEPGSSAGNTQPGFSPGDDESSGDRAGSEPEDEVEVIFEDLEENPDAGAAAEQSVVIDEDYSSEMHGGSERDMATVVINRSEIGMEDEEIEDDEAYEERLRRAGKRNRILALGSALLIIAVISWFVVPWALENISFDSIRDSAVVFGNDREKASSSQEITAPPVMTKAIVRGKAAAPVIANTGPARLGNEQISSGSPDGNVEKARTAVKAEKRSPLILDRPEYRTPIEDLRVDVKNRRVFWRSDFYTCIMLPGGKAGQFVRGTKMSRQKDWQYAVIPLGKTRYNFVSICEYNTYWAQIPPGRTHLGQPVVKGTSGALSYSLTRP